MDLSVRRFLRQNWLRELLVAALLLQALVPPGFVPGLDARGNATLKLCAFYGPAQLPSVVGQAAGGATPGGDSVDHSEHGPCAFFTAVHAALPAAFVTYVPPQFSASAVPDTPVSRHYVSTTPHSRLARGPPEQV